VTLLEALRQSNCWMAERSNDRGYRRRITAHYANPVFPFNPALVRLIASATDPRVEGKPSRRQLDASDWHPVNVNPLLLQGKARV